MPRILHLGCGNFHRAHQAWYTDRAGGWTITGVAMRSRAVPDALNPQNGDYTLVTQDTGGTDYARITCIDRVLFAPDEAQAALDLIADPETHIVSLTITEKGYHLKGDGSLDVDAAAIAADLVGTAAPKTAIGLLAHGLSKRTTPLTVLCCDNLTDNGTRLRGAVTAFADAANMGWDAKVTFPNAMVDRITPATTDALREDVAQETSWNDAAPVATEAFSEWVIEDSFAGPRPDWHRVGVQIVDDVAPFEKRKLRMLNGAHSAMAYGGILRGHTYVHQAVDDPVLRDLAIGVMAEAATTLPDGMDPDSYADSLLTRWENTALDHALRQIAMDGSQKLPMRLVATTQELDGHAPASTQGIAAWIAFAKSETEAGRALDDPAAGTIAAACESEDPIGGLCAVLGVTPALFGGPEALTLSWE
ncbi:mannitol dehydrogenase family protein [Litoreibacter roseus]|uniref:Mannitol dehydrogenase n=1 Tax=Litoreibacter roseus TaxID=2601869 RepID=A0A6N6JGN4_9RHOB|nr:mannitol dehydrogenase family protein [Litoreibacter roseus]GFE65481.1 mannitol dehydrogenase [Litoreibacter roseus]